MIDTYNFSLLVKLLSSLVNTGGVWTHIYEVGLHAA